MLPNQLIAIGLIAWLLFLARSGVTLEGMLGGVLGRRLGGQHRWETSLRTAAAVGVSFVWFTLAVHRPMTVDATVYWSLDLSSLYSGHVNEVGAYLYSPVFAQVLAPFSVLPWPVWYAIWTAINLAAIVWILGPLAALVTLAFDPVGHALWAGNIHFLLAVAAVLALRHPSAWSFPILTKLTPGVTILWDVGARRWKSFLYGIAWTAGLSTVSFVLAPSLWFEWLSILRDSAVTPSPNTLLPLPLIIRLILAAGVVLVGGRLRQPWTIPVALVLAQPVFWTAGLTTLIAVVPLARAGRMSSAQSTTLRAKAGEALNQSLAHPEK